MLFDDAYAVLTINVRSNAVSHMTCDTVLFNLFMILFFKRLIDNCRQIMLNIGIC